MEELAPRAPVKELGNVLPRLLNFMAKVPNEEHIYFSKLDLADGYWQMIVEEEQQWNFAYVMPQPPGAKLMTVVPSALQMGWSESPAFFCARTKTVQNISQTWINHDTALPPHPLEHYTTPERPQQCQISTPTTNQWSGVYVDDHIMAAVEDCQGQLLTQTAQATLHAIHSVFAAPDSTAWEGTKDPILEKKLQKGDGRWATQREILGYLLDGVDRTSQLLHDQANDLLKEVQEILKKQHVQLKQFQTIVGHLQHGARILPVAKAFFTRPLYNALKGFPTHVGLGRHSEVRHALHDVTAMIRDLVKRPTHISELTQQQLSYAGFATPVHLVLAASGLEQLHCSNLTYSKSNGQQTSLPKSFQQPIPRAPSPIPTPRDGRSGAASNSVGDHCGDNQHAPHTDSHRM